MARHAGSEIKMTGARSPGKGHFPPLSNYSRQPRSGDGSAPWVVELPSKPQINLTVLVTAVTLHVSTELAISPLQVGTRSLLSPRDRQCLVQTRHRDVFAEQRNEE